MSFRSTEFRSARFYCTSFLFAAIFSLHLPLGKFSTVSLTICRLNWRFAYAQIAIRTAFCRGSRTCETFNIERICFSPPVKLRSFGEELSGTHRRDDRHRVSCKSFDTDLIRPINFATILQSIRGFSLVRFAQDRSINVFPTDCLTVN